MTLLFQIEADDAGDFGVVTLEALEGAKALAREDGKTWGLLEASDRDRYEHLACEFIVALGGTRV